MKNESSLSHSSSESRLPTIFDRWLPHPILSFALFFLWIALVNEASPGTVIVAGILAIAIPIYSANFWPDRPRIRSPFVAIQLLLIVMWDILVANLMVAWMILFRPSTKLRTRWIVVPLDLRSAESITMLAATITLTPGTVTSDLSADGCSLLVHCLDVADSDAEVARIKRRYERRIKAIFP